MTHLLHISPRLPPAICGVGDYATLVGGRMEELSHDFLCGYVAAGHNLAASGDAASLWRALSAEKDRSLSLAAVSDSRVARRQRYRDNQNRSQASDKPAQPTTVILHYSGYGYSPDGAPTWLAETLENRPPQWRAARVVTFFHELYATGWPWQRAFWHSSRQRRVAERIAIASDALMTNREQSARWLESVTGRPSESVPHLPVPSNVGEPELVPPYEDRPPHAVVFGGVKHKRKFLTGRGSKCTAAACRHLGIIRLTDIGAEGPINRRPFEEAGIEVVQTGYLEKEEVSKVLLEARVGFYSYFPGYLEKSGVLSAYFAYNLAVFGDETIEDDLLTYTKLNNRSISPSGAARRACVAAELSSRCTVESHALKLATLTRASELAGICS